MSTNDPADQPSSSVLGAVRDGMRDLTRDVRREIVPRIPWRAAAIWGAALGATFVIREVYDVLNPTTDFGLRSQWSTLGGLAICFCAGFQAAWRRRDFAHGGVVTLVAILIGFCVAIVVNVAAVLVMSTFRNLDLARQLFWALEVPLPVMLMVGGVVGTVGAAIAAGLTSIRRGALDHGVAG